MVGPSAHKPGKGNLAQFVEGRQSSIVGPIPVITGIINPCKKGHVKRHHFVSKPLHCATVERVSLHRVGLIETIETPKSSDRTVLV